MSNSFYEDTLLRSEFNLVARLQLNAEFSRYVNVSYEDRILGEQRSVLNPPTGARYPERYIVEYRLPVYYTARELRTDWRGVATMELSEPVLTNRHSNHGPHVTFTSNFEPFNNHVRQHAICSGNAWAVAKDNGLWHFIISLGALINQDEFVSADGAHYDYSAYQHWQSRGRRPVTNINWPLNLLSTEIPINKIERPKVDIIPADNNRPPPAPAEPPAGLVITPKITDTPKPVITILPAQKPEPPRIKIIEKIK